MRRTSRRLVWMLTAAALGCGLVFLGADRLFVRRLRGAWLPAVETATGVAWTLEDAAFNVFSRRVTLRDLRAANPAGFGGGSLLRAGRAELRLRLLPLLGGRIEIADAVVDDARLKVVRRDDGRLNIETPGDAKGAEESGAPAARPEPAGVSASLSVDVQPVRAPDTGAVGGRRVPVRIVKARVKARVVVVDVTRKDLPPFKLPLDVRLAAEELCTYAREADTWGKVRIEGRAADRPDTFRIDLRSRVAPLADPRAPTFETEGTVDAIDLARLAPLTEAWEVYGESADLGVRLSCRNGRFDAGRSALSLTLRSPEFRGKLARKARRFKVPPVLTVRAPLGGSVDAPQLDWTTAALQAVLQTIGGSIGGVDDGTGEPGSPLDDQVKDALRRLGDLFK